MGPQPAAAAVVDGEDHLDAVDLPAAAHVAVAVEADLRLGVAVLEEHREEAVQVPGTGQRRRPHGLPGEGDEREELLLHAPEEVPALGHHLMIGTGARRVERPAAGRRR